MNGLNSPALHVGVDLLLLLAESSSVLKELSCDWLGCLWAVGVFYRWWKWDTLWQCSLSIFHWSCRGYECAAESLSLLTVWGFAAYGPCVFSSKACKSFRNTERNLYSFVLDFPVFVLKVSARVSERPWHFFADNILAFLPGFYSSM